MTIDVKPVSLSEAMAFYRLTVQHFLATSGDTKLGMATLTRSQGRLWVFVDVVEGLSRAHSIAAIRAMAKGMRVMASGEPLYVTCNIAMHAQAQRLLTLLGFEPTGEYRNGWEVFRWQS